MTTKEKNLWLFGVFAVIVYVYWRSVKGDKVATVDDQLKAAESTGVVNSPNWGFLKDNGF